jgi:hypothetical protein
MKKHHSIIKEPQNKRAASILSSNMSTLGIP